MKSKLIGVLLLVVGAGAVMAAEGPARPNVVIVLEDDLGVGDLGCYGGTLVATPNIDRMGKEGTRFGQYYSAAPICSPSRAGLLTGAFPGRHRITSYLQSRAGNRGCEQDDYLDPSAATLPRALKGAGYATAHFGKWHLGGGRDVKDAPKFAAYGYDEHAGTYESPEPHPDITASNWIWSEKDKVKRWDRSAFFVDKTVEFLERNKERACFVNLWLDDPHTPWVPAEAAGKGDTRENLKGVMEEMDRQVGRLMEGIRKAGLDERTLVIFTSDNGALPTFGGARSGGYRGSKLSLYEGGIRMPLIARWPGRVMPGRVDEETVIAGVDWMPTLCALAGAKIPEGAAMDGEEMSGALLGKAVERKKALFWEYGRNEKFFGYPRQAGQRSPNVAMREGKWKLLVNSDGTGAELYDVVGDPSESGNVAGMNPGVAGAMKERALGWRRGLPASGENRK
jgi:arylsulfatase A-like enzyme